MTSIRRFLIIVSLAVITLVNFVAALQGYRSGLVNTDALFDAKLVELADVVAELTGNSEAIAHGVNGNKVAYQVLDSEGNVVKRSSLAPEQPLLVESGTFSLLNFNRSRWRVYAADAPVSGNRVIVAERYDDRYFVAEGIILRTIVPILIGLPVLVLLVWLIVTRGLRPLKQLAIAVEAKKSHDLSPIENREVPEELRPLSDAMNQLLGRLSRAFEREKRFSGDAAHELRTPLSALKINLFNLRKQLPEGDADCESMEQSIDRMGHLIEQMLLLYRLSPEQLQSEFVDVDLYALAQQTIADNYAGIEAKHQEISLEGEWQTVTGDPFALTTLVKNLIDNASKYTPEQGRINVVVTQRNGMALLAVEDSGEGIPEEERERILERFYRLQGNINTSLVQGCGLGLSIVQNIVELHGGDLIITRSPALGGLRVEVVLPVRQGELDEN